MRGYAFFTGAIVTLAFAGCHINYSESDGWGADGDIGDFCALPSDCEDELTCWENVCTDPEDVPPPDDNSCTSNADCPAGSFCHEGLGKCVASGECTCDEDCGEGLTCDEELGTCVPGEDPPPPPPPTCEEVETEQECADRADCEPIYAGVNCSCGQDCICTGNEPNCVCESYEFFVCAPVE